MVLLLVVISEAVIINYYNVDVVDAIDLIKRVSDVVDVLFNLVEEVVDYDYEKVNDRT